MVGTRAQSVGWGLIGTVEIPRRREDNWLCQIAAPESEKLASLSPWCDEEAARWGRVAGSVKWQQLLTRQAEQEHERAASQGRYHRGVGDLW